jgi:hypothetical protein
MRKMKIRDIPSELKLFLYFMILAVAGTFFLSLPFMYKDGSPYPLLEEGGGGKNKRGKKKEKKSKKK